MPRSEFNPLVLSGDALTRGAQYGETCSSLIIDTIEVYRRLFESRVEAAPALAERFRERIQAFAPDYVIEMDAIARSANVDRWWIYALNARTEILNLDIPECTSVGDSRSCTLAQTWDWMPELEELLIEMRLRRPDGLELLMLVEPGQIGKIGLNSAGVGVALNILFCPLKQIGIPVHVLMRSILDCASADAALDVVTKAAPGRASNLTVADASGACWHVEFADDACHITHQQGDALVHTNHYLSMQEPANGINLDGSRCRQTTATRLLAEGMDASGIVSDTQNGDDAICAPYHEMPPIGQTGTIFSAVMKLDDRTLRYRRGNNPASAWIHRTV